MSTVKRPQPIVKDIVLKAMMYRIGIDIIRAKVIKRDVAHFIMNDPRLDGYDREYILSTINHYIDGDPLSNCEFASDILNDFEIDAQSVL